MKPGLDPLLADLMAGRGFLAAGFSSLVAHNFDLGSAREGTDLDYHCQATDRLFSLQGKMPGAGEILLRGTATLPKRWQFSNTLGAFPLEATWDGFSDRRVRAEGRCQGQPFSFDFGWVFDDTVELRGTWAGQRYDYRVRQGGFQDRWEIEGWYHGKPFAATLQKIFPDTLRLEGELPRLGKLDLTVRSIFARDLEMTGSRDGKPVQVRINAFGGNLTVTNQGRQTLLFARNFDWGGFNLARYLGFVPLPFPLQFHAYSW